MMFKLVVLSALLAVAVAHPGLGLESSLVVETPIVREHSLEKVGAIVNTVPTAVSHQSSSIVHNSGFVVKPIVAPVVKTYAAAPIVKAYSAPIVNSISTPLVQTYAANPWAVASPSQFTYSGIPLTYSAPLRYATSW